MLRNAMINGCQTVKGISNATSIVQCFVISNALVNNHLPEQILFWPHPPGVHRNPDVIPVNIPKPSEAREPSCVTGSCIKRPWMRKYFPYDRTSRARVGPSPLLEIPATPFFAMAFCEQLFISIHSKSRWLQENSDPLHRCGETKWRNLKSKLQSERNCCWKSKVTPSSNRTNH